MPAVSAEHRLGPAVTSVDAVLVAMAAKSVDVGGVQCSRYSSSLTMNHKTPDIIEDLWYCKDNELLHDAWRRNLEEQIRLEIASDFEHEVIRGRAKSHRKWRERERQLYGHFEIPKPKKGEILLGTNRRGEQLRFPVASFSRPNGICGETGCGKSNLTKAVALQLCPHLNGTFFFDTVKKDMRELQAPFKRVGVDCLVLSGNSLRLNLLQLTKGVPVERQIATRAALLADLFQLPQRSRKLLTSILYQLYREKPNPTLFDVYLAVLRADRANSQARSALLDALEPLLRSMKCLRYHVGWSIQDLLSRCIVFELDDLPQIGQQLVMSVLMLWAFEFQLAQQRPNRSLELMIFVDEALPLLTSSQSPIVNYIGLIRGAGVSAWLNTQTTIPVDQIVLANLPNRWLGPVSSYRDIESIGASMGLSAEQKRSLTHLPVGRFLAKLGGESSPMLIDVPLVKTFSQPVTTGIGALAHVAVEELTIPMLDETLNIGQADGVTKLAVADESPQSPSATKLTDDEVTYLDAVIAKPCQPVSFYANDLKFSKRRATDVRRSLVNLGFLQEQKAQTSRRGRPSILLAPTAAGQAAGEK